MHNLPRNTLTTQLAITAALYLTGIAATSYATEPAESIEASAAAPTNTAAANADSTIADSSNFDAAAEMLFVKSVLPLFRQKCFACHGADPDEIRGEFQMLTRQQLFDGGESGLAAVVAGDPASSLLMDAIRWEGLEMPPKENDRLDPKQISQVRAWIAGGAPWPDEARRVELLRMAEKQSEQDAVRVATSGGLSAQWTDRTYEPENLWAYQPLNQPEPIGRSADNPIDRFIDQQLAEIGLTAATSADRRTLIRRATFDLIGLPPSPRDVAEFLADPAPDEVAFAKVVDRLLASPHYGEQWARHWLDVVRYADSSGYANDYERGNAWRYRDYVIRSFNADKPYDRFIREQIAGDEMDPNDPELLVAVGFLRMGPWELTGMEVAKVARQRFLDDVTDAVGQVFLAHMLQCARCHDHKFDPVPTRDYYSMQAVFATTQIADRQAKFLAEENTNGFEERELLTRRMKRYQRQLSEVRKKTNLAAARRWYEDRGLDTTLFEQVLTDVSEAGEGDVDLSQVREELIKRDAPAEYVFPQKVGFRPEDYGLERIARKGMQRLRWRLERYEPTALSVYSGRTPQVKGIYTPPRMPDDVTSKGELEQTHILAGGDPFRPTVPVEPGMLSAVELSPSSSAVDRLITSNGDGEVQPIPTSISGRRLALARWISSPANPLTARVMVNRIWQWHFGQAIAGNANNFGATGKKPTHPRLLDFLASRFRQEGWSIKAMHRLMMNSQAYRRASSHPRPQALASRDPLGTSYAAFQPRRLDAEELRDAMLCVSGELNPKLGGIPNRPEMNLEAALQPRMVMGTFAEAWQPSPLPQQRHRRSIYALKLRGLRDPFLEVFNKPSADNSCEARESSTVTPQVFAMFNSEITFDRALALAARLGRETDLTAAPDTTINRLFHLAYNRPPHEQELNACLTHWDRMTTRHQHISFPPPEYPTEVVREAVEENTGVKFQYVEPLEVYEQFVPDLKPADASAKLRGLAEVCLVVLNSNEFLYVY